MVARVQAASAVRAVARLEERTSSKAPVLVDRGNGRADGGEHAKLKRPKPASHHTTRHRAHKHPHPSCWRTMLKFVQKWLLRSLARSGSLAQAVPDVPKKLLPARRRSTRSAPRRRASESNRSNAGREATRTAHCRLRVSAGSRPPLTRSRTKSQSPAPGGRAERVRMEQPSRPGHSPSKSKRAGEGLTSLGARDPARRFGTTDRRTRSRSARETNN